MRIAKIKTNQLPEGRAEITNRNVINSTTEKGGFTCAIK